MNAQQRRQGRVSRRRHRLQARGPARRHWERRRRGQANSAPQRPHGGADSYAEMDEVLTAKKVGAGQLRRLLAAQTVVTSTRPDDYQPRPGRKAKKYRRG